MSHLHAEFHFQDIELQESGAVDASIPAEPNVRNFSFCIRNGKFYYRENAIMREVSLGATSAARMRLPVSYTHLDVYKRQALHCARYGR